MDELKDAYMMKLARVLDIEETLVVALPKMIAKASNDKLIAGLTDHLEETKEHASRIKQVMSTGSGAAQTEPDEAFRLMIETASKEIAKIEDKDVRDAVIIASAQTAEHIEIAKYGTLIAWAKQLDEDTDLISMLEDTLSEEEVADKKLSAVAEGSLFAEGVNSKAAERVA